MMLTKAFLSLSLLIVVTVQTELLRNPNFSSPLSSSDWTCNGCTGNIVQESYLAGGQSFLTSKRKASWAGPMQTLSLDGKQLGVGGYYTLSCQVKLANKSPSPQRILVQLSRALQSGKTEYTHLAEWRDVTIDSGWIPLVSDFPFEDLGPIKTMKLYISGPVPSVDFLSSQCSMKEFKPTDWKKEAYRRIDSIRKGNMNVTVQTDKPLRKVQVKIELINHEFGFGSAVGAAELANNAAYRQWYLDNFEWAVIENDMKWRQNEWNQNRLTFDKADAAMQILKDNGKKVRGHTVFWAMTERVPNWLQKVTNKTELYELCEKRAKDVVGRYKGRIEHWDVNNEMLPNRFFADTYGSESIRNDMFKMVREIDANVKLFLNDYSIVSDGLRLGMYIGQAKSFLADGVQVQALGVQSHFNSRPRGPLILKRLDRLAAAGLPLWVTELDYADSSDQELADALKDALLAFFSHPSVEGVLFWGFHADRHHRGSSAVLVDENDKANAAGKMWQNLFHKVWRTNQAHTLGYMRAGAVSTTSFRGFYGDYKITVTTNGTVVHTRNVTMSKANREISVKVILGQPVIG